MPCGLDHEDKYETCPKKELRVILTYNVKCERQAKQNVHQLSDCFIPLEQLFI